MLFSKGSLQVLMERVNLVNIISKLQDNRVVHSGGGHYECICPFCEDKDSTMDINTKFQRYHCYNCLFSGDAVDFLLTYKKMSFVTAVEYLADLYDVRLVEADSKKKLPKKDKEGLKASMHKMIDDMFVLGESK